MYKPAKIAIIIAIILLTFGLLRPALAADRQDPSALNLMSDEDRAALDQGHEVDVIVELDQTEAATMAAERKRRGGLIYEDEVTLAERVQIYRRHKDEVLSALSAEPISVQREYSHLPMLSVRLRSPAALRALLKQPRVKAIYSIVELRLMLAQSLPLINQPETAAQGGNGAGTTVAVIDSGVNYTLPAFGSCSAPGGSCKVIFAGTFPGNTYFDEVGHGTNVAGIVLGVAPGARIAALDVTVSGGTLNNQAIIDAINWAIANKTAYNIVAMNLSLSGGHFAAPCPTGGIMGLAAPITLARAAGILAAVASGNEGYKDSIGEPACVPAAVSVGAVYDANIGSNTACGDWTTQADQVTCFSNSASFLTLLAPGMLITAAGITQQGTSQAAPHVAGAIAVLRAAYPSESLDATVARMTSTGVPIGDVNGIVTPRLDLLAAYTANSTPADSYEPDNSSAQASPFSAGTSQTHSIAPVGDQDWVRFTLAQPSGVVLETAGASGDTEMWLYNSALVQQNYNDDNGASLFSRIERTCAASPLPAGTYYVKVSEYGNNETVSSYTLSFQATPCSGSNPGSGSDLNGDRRDDIVGLNSTGAIYYTINLSTWTNIPGQLSQLLVGDFDGDGKADDLAGLNAAGKVYYTTNLSTWRNIPGSLSKIVVGDFDGDGKADDLAGLNGAGKVYYTTNLSAWRNIPGTLSKIVVGDFDGDGKADDLAGLNGAGKVYYTTNLSTWRNIPGSLSKIVVGDFDGDGKADDLAGLNGAGKVYYTTNLSTWRNIPGSLSKIVVGDFDGDGKADDLAGLNGAGNVYYTTNLSTWRNIPGTLSKIVVGDFDGDGKADDLAGLNGAGNVYYTTNLSTWRNIPGKLNRLAGDDD
ncbi:MAG TPA: S8 family serine peptidase [Candidatus Competibacter sp.]|nr:S8 family serine peptidase [Candidatus Competibacter sp.]